MKSIIKQVGPFKLKTRNDRFPMLVNSIVSQQISTAAARTIYERLENEVKPAKICPESLAALTLDELREIGLSRQKASYLQDLSHKVETGLVSLNTMGRLDDHQVIEQLTTVKGIGNWTAQMFLIFSLGRLDVLPVDDVGIQNAIQQAYQTGGAKDKSRIEMIAKPWKPYSTIACWYLWQSLELPIG